MTRDAMCSVYDQISDRRCRYFAGHGGSHNFARLGHDCSLERELRGELDVMVRAITEALNLFDANWCPAHGHSPTPEAFDQATKLWNLVRPAFSRETYP